jgi:hypothetical protein
MSALAHAQPGRAASGGGANEAAVLRRKCACGTHTISGQSCGSCAERERAALGLRGAEPESDIQPVVHDVLRAPGEPLDSNVAATMSVRIGQDFSSVRVHNGAKAADAARSLDALAFTAGRDIVFGAGQYNPASLRGRHILGHELAHVAQQGGGNGRLRADSAALQIGRASDPAEVDADRVADLLATDKPIPSVSPRVPALRRLSKEAGIGIGIGVGSAVLIGGGFGIAAALGAFSSKDDVPSLKDSKFRERWEKALQEGLNLLESKHPKDCPFPENEQHKYDDKNWSEETVGPLQGKGYTPKGGTPYDSVAGLYQNMDKWECDCRLFSEIAILYAWYGSLSKEQFNKKFAGFRLTAETTTGLDRKIIGSGLGESADNPEEVSDKDWHEAPVGSKAVWRNTSPAAHVPWEYEHAVKRFKGRTSAEDLYAAQGVGYHATEDQVKRKIARESEDSGAYYAIDDAVLTKLKTDGTPEEVIRDLATIKDQSFKTSAEFLKQPPLLNLQKHRENKTLLDKIMEASAHDPPPDKMEKYIRTYIRRDKVEIPQ